MHLVSADGLTLLGPGSEWFWSMLQFLVVAITLVGIYVQVREEHTANTFAKANALKQEWEGEFLIRRRLGMILALRDGKPTADVVTFATPVANFWEHVGALVRAGHIAPSLVYQYLGSACQTTWNLLEPLVRQVRAEEGEGVWSDFEWLVKRLERERRGPAGADGTFGRELLAERAPSVIASLSQSLRDFEEMRRVVVAPVAPWTDREGPTTPDGPEHSDQADQSHELPSTN